MTSERRTSDKQIVDSFVHNYVRKGQILQNQEQKTPKELIEIIYIYYLEWKWDPQSNKDKRLEISNDLMTVTAIPSNYIDPLTFTSIYMDNWISLDGRYYFKFRFHGNCIGTINEIAIGLISKEYDIGNRFGIGYDENGWSWYVYDPNASYTYYKTFDKPIQYGLSDQNECSLEIFIENGICKTYLHYVETEGIEPEVIEYDKVQVPVKIGVSLNSKQSPMSLEIIEQERPLRA